MGEFYIILCTHSVYIIAFQFVPLIHVVNVDQGSVPELECSCGLAFWYNCRLDEKIGLASG